MRSLVETLGLEPHPEGGYYRQTYKAAGTSAGRHHSTAIYFYLAEGDVSRLHRLRSDEVWHFYDGGPLSVFELTPDGALRETVLGRDLAAGQTPQHVVPAGHWFGARPRPGSGWSLVGCTVAPGFEFEDFELADRRDLLARYPAHRDLITALTHD